MKLPQHDVLVKTDPVESTVHIFHSPDGDVCARIIYFPEIHTMRIDSSNDNSIIHNTNELDLSYLHDQPFFQSYQLDGYETSVEYHPGCSALRVSVHYDDDDENSPATVLFVNVPIIVRDSNGNAVISPDDPDEYDYFVMHTTS